MFRNKQHNVIIVYFNFNTHIHVLSFSLYVTAAEKILFEKPLFVRFYKTHFLLSRSPQWVD